MFQSGMYWLNLIDWYSSGFPLMTVAVLEIGCLSWNYGRFFPNLFTVLEASYINLAFVFLYLTDD